MQAASSVQPARSCYTVCLPCTWLPGVGPYTAAAVASIAFGTPAAAVDGNVVRVLSRLRVLSGDPARLGPAHAALAQRLLDEGRPGDWNQVSE
jgi:A/G-specific adenine glycosylase